MIPISTLIEMECEHLDAMGQSLSGSQLAEFIALRTQKYLVQEIIGSLRQYGHIEAANHLEIMYKD